MEDKLVNKIFKGLIRFLIEVIVMTVLIVGINIFTNGMYLWGLPRINDIQSVNITYPSVTDDVKEISSSEDIELALKLTGFLKYDLFGEVNSEEEPAITITYFLKDGTSKTISANNTTVWWNNKIHVIKDKEMFVNLKQLEKLRKSLKQKLEKLQGTDRKDDVVTFEQLGVDRLFVDESQAFKNLYLYTKMRNVAGLSTSEAQKSSDMFGKCRYLDEITGGRGVIFATGTPLSNSMTEMYTLMRYLQYNTLQQKGLTHFDAWASTFGETTTAIELAPEGYTLIGR